jgi:ACS family hexuronate transporter-like MFS transporter
MPLPTLTPSSRRTHYRWVICALLFFATTINYIDRQVLGILAPTLTKEFGWSEAEYGAIVTAFQAAYALGLLGVGRLMDWLGTRWGFSLSMVAWSVAAMAHSLAGSVLGFSAARFALGLGESGNFPACIKTVAEWFPRKERAFAAGLFNAGSNIGAIVAPLMVPAITIAMGWRWAFVITGAIGFFWLIAWVTLYGRPENHPRVNDAERAHIESDPPDAPAKFTWDQLLRHRQTLAFALAKFLTDPIWWFYLYWVPKFLNKQYGLTLDKMGPPLVVIYLMADVGSIGGGWLSSFLIRRGWSVNRARKTAMLLCALCVTPIVFASQASHLWVAVSLLGLATAAHQGWSANLFTTATDMFPRRAIGSIVGLGGMAGSIGGMVVATAAGFILQATGSYWTLFVIAGSAYLLALGVFHLLVPRLEPAKL